MQLLGARAAGFEARDSGDERDGIGARRVPLVVIELAGHRCALLASAVVELHRMVATVPLPGAPPSVEGAIDLRGTLVGVVDLRARFGLPVRTARASDHLVVVAVAGMALALRVDRVADLDEVPGDQVTPPPPLPGAVSARGLARLDDGLVLIYDLDAFLTADEAAAMAAALDQLRPVQSASR